YVDRENSTSPRTMIRFRVLQSWKGAAEERVVLHTRRRDRGCEGLPKEYMEPSLRLLVYAARVSGTRWGIQTDVLTTDACAPTKLSRNAKRDIEILKRRTTGP